MDPSLQYQQQQQQQQAYDPPQVQPYDPSSAAYYSFHQYNQQLQQQHYPYYAQDYSNAYQQQQSQSEETSSIHPPGVAVTDSQYLGQTDLQNQQYQYYAYQQQQQQLESAQQQWPGSTVGVGQEVVHTGARPPIGQTPYMGGGRRGGRGRGFGPSFRGRGRGRGRGGPTHKPTAIVQGESSQTTSIPPPRMAWCELCRVDCNSLEILETHKNGKKHKKNLKTQEELERLNKIIVERQKVEESAVQETNETKIENEQQNVSEMDKFGSRGRGSKRKMRGGRGGKWMRTNEGAKKPIETPKPKQVPFVCELCNVTCESQVVFDSHLKGRKHIGNLQRFQEQQTLLGQAALEALYPALQALLPGLQGVYPPNPDASTSSVAPQFQQGAQDPQVILTQLLTSMFAPGQATVTPGLRLGLQEVYPPNPDDSTSSVAPQFHQGAEDPQVVVTQLLASMFAPGQVTVTPGLASTSASGPPLVTENQDHEDPKHENVLVASEAGCKEPTTVETKSLVEPDSITSEGEPATTTENKSENVGSESGMEKVNAHSNNLAVKP